MAANERSSDPYLTLLTQQGEELNFFQAIRLLERAVADIEKVRFSAKNSQAFHPNFIAGIEQKLSHQDIKVKVNGFTLTGMQGPIPQSFSDLLRYSEIKSPNGKEDPNQFLDIFHDRIITLLYQIKKRFNPLLFNQAQTDHELYRLFSSVCGFEQLNVFEHLPVSQEHLASMSPIMANKRLDYSLVHNLLQQSFKCEVKVHPNQGAWKELPKEFQAKLTVKSKQLSSIQQQGLGNGIGLGRKHWHNQAVIGLDLSLPDIESLTALLPSKDKNSEHYKLKNLLTFLSDGKYQFNVRLFLNWQQIPLSKLSKQTATPALKLGQNSWLKTKTSEQAPASEYPAFVVYPGFEEAAAKSKGAVKANNQGAVA